MSKSILILEQEHPVHQLYYISGPTQIGRAENLNWAVKDRNVPEVFSKLEAVISVENSKQISRNHAGIYQENNLFYIVDLNSLNHTLVNEEIITDPKLLSLGDRINFPKDLELKVVAFKEVNTNNHCLLVGNTGKNLRGVKRDLDELATQLDKRGFVGNITKMYNNEASKKKVLKQLDQIAYLTTPDSHFIFYFSGHGSESGIYMSFLNTISPSELYQKLANIRGKKAVILDCCHAGIFLNDKNKPKIPPDCLVLTASSESGYAYEKPNYTIAGGAYMGRFSAALVNYLNVNRDRLNLKNFKERLDTLFDNRKMTIYYQEPIVTGHSFTIMTAHTMIFNKEA